jgi:hypothetical protein
VLQDAPVAPLLVGLLAGLLVSGWQLAFDRSTAGSRYRAARRDLPPSARRAWYRSLRRGAVSPPLTPEQALRVLPACEGALASPWRVGGPAFAVALGLGMTTVAGVASDGLVQPGWLLLVTVGSALVASFLVQPWVSRRIGRLRREVERAQPV